MPLTSGFGGKDAFVVTLDDAGLYQWGGSIRSMDNEDAWGLSVDDNYNVYVTGYSASGNIALNPFANNTVPNNSTTGNDVFVVKLAQPTLSNADFESNNSFVVYPNPVKEILYIENYLNRNIETIRVVDVSGKVVLEQKGNERSVNLSNLNTGFYIVFITSEGKVSSQKIIKE